jgi:hypothetical protein
MITPSVYYFGKSDNYLRDREVYPPNLDEFRHPEHTEITGFRLPDHVRHRPRRNDAFMGFQTFYETVNL